MLIRTFLPPSTSLSQIYLSPSQQLVMCRKVTPTSYPFSSKHCSAVFWHLILTEKHKLPLLLWTKAARFTKHPHCTWNQIFVSIETFYEAGIYYFQPEVLKVDLFDLILGSQEIYEKFFNAEVCFFVSVFQKKRHLCCVIWKFCYRWIE